MLKSEYRSYVASEAWLQRRKQFLWNHSACERCGISREAAIAAYGQDLHVHHKNYQHVGCESDSDLEALCRRCHEIETFGKSELPNALLVGSDLATYRGLIGPDASQTVMTEHGLAGLFR
jgi:hypothetical protein